MPTCEKCWKDSNGNPRLYDFLIQDRKGDKVCTPEEQAGEDADICPKCNRKTIHIHCHICMVCGWRSN